MTMLEWVLAGFLLIYLGSLAAVALVVRNFYRRMRRSRAVSGAMLRTRTRLSLGRRHEVLSLRLRLDNSLASGQAAVDLAAHSEYAHGEIPRLFRRIQAEGIALESQLRLMESETDPAVLAEAIPVARRRVEAVASVVHELRSVVATGLAEESDAGLERLRSDVDIEVSAMNAGLRELHNLNGYDARQNRRQHGSNPLEMNRLSRGNKP
ncbi:hypothetical protein [Mycetocola zhadangensis]|uniref:Uncharacterized protein n=1 Tax=Mycetocola zhadangensis TaxID=1164595 RepID=A0A3L7J6U6_9MICO|nr:hypothetical protein [Mycetocola zhadangensis]RLQ86393.1 hypothetical protein D9V28_06145 [Mycetocola zhadangensis]GGE90829.1 hypothetical protein GCM10011313_12140 [Mycetocola zhadangensis]